MTDPTWVASRWFAVVGEYERVTRPGMAARIARWLVAFVATWGALEEFDPKRSCTVIILRRDTGDRVLTFSYPRLGEATTHLVDLRERLERTHVLDFCRELGLSPDLVSGPGQDLPDEREPWVGVA